MRLKAPRWGTMVVCALAAAAPGQSEAATIAVPAGGNLQAALNAAAPGDVITLTPGATYIGNFVLPVRPVTTPAAFITIRSAASDGQLPPDGVRITPQYAALLPKIRSANSTPALRTAPGAHHWRIMFVEFQANANGYGDILALGAGDSSQTLLSQVPYSLVLDRVYVHGDPVVGQKRGIALNSRDTTIVNSYIADIKTVGQDTQAIGGFNGPGNYLIENNYLEAATENFMLGGSDPPIVNLVTSNVIFRRNYLSKPLAWRNPIIAPPADVTAAAAIGSGSLAAGTYSYKVVARIPAGQGNIARSAASVEAAATLPAGATGGVTISWTPVAGATEYYVYGRAAGAQNMYWKTTNAFFTDSGSAGMAGTPGSATKWSVKNLFELKNAQDVLIEENLFENCWVADQTGYAIVFTPRNQNGGAPWAVVQRVTFRNNLIQHSAGAVNILGSDNLAPSMLTNNVTIRDNIFHDIGSPWGTGSTKAFLIGAGGDAIVFDHNTLATTASTVVSVYGGSVSSPTPVTNFRYTNNMSEHRNYGIFGDGLSFGMAAINAYFPGSTITRNVLAGGSASRYPAGNYFPSVTSWKSNFVDFASADYHLLPSSAYRAAGTDGADLGANVDAVLAGAAIAVSGDNRGVSVANRIQILTTALPNGTVNVPYAQPIACSGGTPACAWQVVSATLPAGLSFDVSTGTLQGTPTRVETGMLQLTAFDPSMPANNATAAFNVTTDAPPFAVTMPLAPPAQVGSPYQLVPTVSGAVGSVSWTIVSGSLPSGLQLDPLSGVIAGMPIAWGSSAAVVQALDSWQPTRIAAAPVTISVSPAPIAVAAGPLPAATYREYYQALLHATGGTGAFTWSLESGSLPAGVMMDANGVISGTPTAVGTFASTITVKDANWPSLSATATLTLTVNPPPFTAALPPPPAARVGFPFQMAGTSAGQIGTVSWVVASGALPTGLVLNTSAGTIAGTPTAAGLFSSVVQARDSWSSSRVVSIPLTIAVAPSDITIATTTLPAAAVQKPYQAALAASGGTGQTTWSLVSGSLPAGLTLSTSGGISGTPANAGATTFTVRAVDAGWTTNTATATLTLTVTAREVVLYATDASLVRGTWLFVDDPTAANGKRIVSPDFAAPKLLTPLAAPANYFEISFEAEAGVPYHLWVRGKAVANYWGNDSAYVQFSGSLDQEGGAVARIGSTDALTVSVENGTNAGLSGWGWGDDSYEGFGSTIYFATTGTQTIRVQVREDGMSIDQIVLSAERYATAAPGATKNDTVIVPR